MGPWAAAIVTVASLAAVFFAVMGFRGLIEAVENFSGRCVTCGRATMLPLPTQPHQCRRCHYVSLLHPLGGRASVRHSHHG